MFRARFKSGFFYCAALYFRYPGWDTDNYPGTGQHRIVKYFFYKYLKHACSNIKIRNYSIF